MVDGEVEHPMPRLPFHEQAISACTRRAAAASAQYDEVKKQQLDLQQQLETASKKDAPPLQEALDQLEAEVAKRRATSKEAGAALHQAQRARKQEHHRIFARMQAIKDIEQAKQYMDAHAAAKAEAAEELTRAREERSRAQREQQVQRQAAAKKAARDLATRTFELQNPWRSTATRPSVLDRKVRAALGVEPEWSGAWRGGDLFAPPRRVGRTAWVAPPTPEAAPEPEPEALVVLKQRVAQNMVRVSELFRKWDRDGDGAVSKEEMRHALCALSIPFDAESLDMLFRSIDTDGTGTLDFEELRHALRRQMPLQPPSDKVLLQMPKRTEPHPGGTDAERRAVAALKKALQPALGKVASLVREWDVDGDGQITKNELKRALAAQCIPVDEAALRALFRQLDQDGSGAIEFHEINRAIRRNFRDDAELAEAVEIPSPSASGPRRPQTAPPTVAALGQRGRGPPRTAPPPLKKRTESARFIFNKRMQKFGETNVREMIAEKDEQAREIARAHTKAGGLLGHSRTAPILKR